MGVGVERVRKGWGGGWHELIMTSQSCDLTCKLGKLCFGTAWSLDTFIVMCDCFGLSWEQLVHSHSRFARIDSGYRKSMRQYTAGNRTLLPVGLQKVSCSCRI